MKLNDLKEHRRLDEKLADWVGNYGAAALKQLGNRITGDPEGHASIADKHTKERFVNNFLGRAYASLNAEIESGRVDPGLRSSTGASPAAAPTAEPAAPASTAPTASGAARPSGSAKVAPGDAKAPGYTQRQTNQNINNYVRGMASTLNKETDRNKKIALTKELINFMADRKGYPEWENAVATAKSILQKNQAGGNMIRALQGGQRVSEAWNVYWINKLLESVNLTWKDVGLTLLKENKKNGKYIIAETKFYKLNNIFESVLTEAETIGQFMKRWLPTYMRGTDMSDQHTQNLIQKVEDTYPRDKGQEAMKQLATAAYAASYAPGYSGDSAGAAPGGAGAAPGGAGAAPGGAGAAPGGAGGGAVKTSADQLISSIRSGLAKLKALDPATYSKFVKELSGGSSASTTSTAPSTGPAAEPASSTEVPSTVSSPAPKSGLPRPAARPALSGPATEVGDTSSTGGSTFSSPGVTRHKSAGGREEMQQRARAAADAAKQARAASQRKGLPTTRPVLPNAAAPRLK